MTEAARPQITASTSSDRRRFPRLETDSRADIVEAVDNTVEEPASAQVLNVSRSGLAIRTEKNMRVGSTMSLVVYFSGYDSVCLGELVWKRREKGQWLYGVLVRRWSFLDPLLDAQLTGLERRSGAPGWLPPAA